MLPIIRHVFDLRGHSCSRFPSVSKTVCQDGSDGLWINGFGGRILCRVSRLATTYAAIVLRKANTAIARNGNPPVRSQQGTGLSRTHERVWDSLEFLPHLGCRDAIGISVFENDAIIIMDSSSHLDGMLPVVTEHWITRIH